MSSVETHEGLKSIDSLGTLGTYHHTLIMVYDLYSLFILPLTRMLLSGDLGRVIEGSWRVTGW